MSEQLWIEETHINEDEGYMMSEPYIYETFAAAPGELFRALLGECGRCVSKVYVDSDEGRKAIGWVFEKTDRYEDTGDPFKHITWVSLVDGPATITREVNYLPI